MAHFLTLLGGASLVGNDGPLRGPAAQRHRLALLALLAAARGSGIARDRAAAYLWPESDTDRARNSLKQTVHAIRRTLGTEAIVSVGDDLRLDPALVATDLAAFEHAAADNDAARAVASYGGPFLDGFFLRDAPEFERWIEGERARLHASFAAMLEVLAISAERAGNLDGAVVHWRRLAAEFPGNSRFALGLMRALAAAGDRVSAIRHAEVHALLLKEEFGAEPDAEVMALAERLRTSPERAAQSAGTSELRSDAQGEAQNGDRPKSNDIGTYHANAGAQRVAPVESERIARPDVMSAPSPAPVAKPSTSWSRRTRWAVVAAVALVLAAVPQTLRRFSAPEKGRSLVVLPFVEMDASRDSAYFGDGLTEELIHALSNAGDLRVTARTSAFQFKGKNVDVREIGRRLGVGMVLEGSVRRGDGRMRITAQLVSATDGTHLWSRTYDRQLDDALAVQEEISQSITSALRLQLRGAASPLARHSSDREAYLAYLKGRYAASQRIPGAVRQAIDFYKQAIARDSSYALAYVGLAEAYVSIEDVAGATPDSILPLARAAAMKALEHDSTLAEAHGLLADLHTEWWEWDDARREFDRAFALEEPSPLMLIWYSRWLDNMGRFDEALDVTRRALELDPLSGTASYNYAGTFLHLGRPEPAIVEARRLIQLQPTLPLGYDMLGWALVDAKRPSEAIAPLERAVELGGGRWLALSNLGRAYAGVGRRDDAHAVIDRLERDWGRVGYGNFAIAAIHVALGEREKALARIERVYRLRQAKLPHVRQWSAFEPLYGDTAFSRIVRAAGFEPPKGVAR